MLIQLETKQVTAFMNWLLIIGSLNSFKNILIQKQNI